MHDGLDPADAIATEGYLPAAFSFFFFSFFSLGVSLGLFEAPFFGLSCPLAMWSSFAAHAASDYLYQITPRVRE